MKVPSPFGCWCFHLIQNSSFANLLCCRGGLDWQMVCLFRKPQNGCGVTIFSNNKTKHLTSCCSENLIHKQYIRHQSFYGSFSPFLLLSIWLVVMWFSEISICFRQPSFNSEANLQRKIRIRFQVFGIVLWFRLPWTLAIGHREMVFWKYEIHTLKIKGPPSAQKW